MMISLSIAFLGLICIVKGADWFVNGAASVASRLRVSPIIIGLTIVAFGTSLPELVVNLMASFQGTSGLAIGNVMGSNIANVLLILGGTAMITPLILRRSTVWREIPLAILAAILVFMMGNDGLFVGRSDSILDRIDGMVLICFFFVYLYYTFGISRKDVKVAAYDKLPWMKSIVFLFLGAASLYLGGLWTVSGAEEIARVFGLSDALIGLTVVGIGTSLPEFATTFLAARRGHADLAIGNAIGSNIFNIFWVLGMSATIRPLSFSMENGLDAFFAVAASILLFLVMFIGKRHTLGRWEGLAFLGIYAAYLVFRFQF
jgi:cation:H+ antiporter